MTERTRSLLVKMSDGTQKRIHGIPANAKVTFGKVQPGEDRYGQGTYCLRVYTTQNNQLAVFTGVREFRDMSLTVESRSELVKAKATKTRNGDGELVESTDNRKVSREWEEEE